MGTTPTQVYKPMPTALSASLLSGKSLCEVTGLSRWFWSDRRNDGSLIEGVHYVRAGRVLRYRPDLIHDGLSFGFSSREHQRTCQRFLESLPSNAKK